MDATAAEVLLPKSDRENEGNVEGEAGCAVDEASTNCRKIRGVLAEFFDGAFNFRAQQVGEEEEEDDPSMKTSSHGCEKVDLSKKGDEECGEKSELVSEKVLSSNEKCKKSGSKRPPKPPLPPRGPSLDASDRKLLREFAEIAMRKRERIARLKALKRMRAAKGSSSSSSPSKANISAMIITVIFFLVMMFHGLGSKENPNDNFEGSPLQAETNFLSVHHYNPPAFPPPLAGEGGKRQRQRRQGRHGGRRHRKIWRGVEGGSGV